LRYGARYKRTVGKKRESFELPDWCVHTSTWVPDEWTKTLIDKETTMAFEHQPGKGTMFRNDSTNPKAPLWSGTVHIPEDAAGKTMQIAAWYNESYTDNTGATKKEKWSLSITPPWDGGQSNGSRPTYHTAEPKVHTKDDIPF